MREAAAASPPSTSPCVPGQCAGDAPGVRAVALAPVQVEIECAWFEPRARAAYGVIAPVHEHQRTAGAAGCAVIFSSRPARSKPGDQPTLRPRDQELEVDCRTA